MCLYDGVHARVFDDLTGEVVFMVVASIAGIMMLSMFQGVFTMDDDGQVLNVFEDGKPVLCYRYMPGELPKLVQERYRRACYIHPLYGLDGEVMTQDFPFDHRHHRGVFWGWPDSTIGDRKADVWALDGIRQVHSEWVEKKVDDDRVVIAVVNNWIFDDAPEKPIIREDVRVVVHPAEEQSRAIDFEITFTNVTEELFTIRGAHTDGKGYGGFCVRPDATRKPFQFTSALGKRENGKDVTDEEFPSPWADVSFATEEDGKILSGMAVFQHPGNQGYPQNKWILRHYGFLGHSWPHVQGYELKPGASVSMRYRLLVHRGDADAANVASAFEQYQREMK